MDSGEKDAMVITWLRRRRVPASSPEMNSTPGVSYRPPHLPAARGIGEEQLSVRDFCQRVVGRQQAHRHRDAGLAGNGEGLVVHPQPLTIDADLDELVGQQGPPPACDRRRGSRPGREVRGTGRTAAAQEAAQQLAAAGVRCSRLWGGDADEGAAGPASSRGDRNHAVTVMPEA